MQCVPQQELVGGVGKMIVKFGSVSAVAAIIISAGLLPADARGAVPSLHGAWTRPHAEVFPVAYTPAQPIATLRQAHAQKRRLRD